MMDEIENTRETHPAGPDDSGRSTSSSARRSKFWAELNTFLATPEKRERAAQEPTERRHSS